MSKIELKDTMMLAIMKMSGGNPGSMTCLMELSKGEYGFNFVLMLDTLEVYDEKIYMLWNDCCDRDTEKMKLVIKNWQQGGYITKEEIHDHLSGGYGKPFENVKSVKELDECFDKIISEIKGE